MTIPSRIVVCETVYHQGGGLDPIAVDNQFSRWTKTDEQPYQRRVEVLWEWQSLDLGWLEDNVGMVLIHNEPTRHARTPTAAQKEEADKKIVEVGMYIRMVGSAPFALVLPGESIRLTPVNVKELHIRCREGSTRCTITLLPA